MECVNPAKLGYKQKNSSFGKDNVNCTTPLRGKSLCQKTTPDGNEQSDVIIHSHGWGSESHDLRCAVRFTFRCATFANIIRSAIFDIFNTN